MTKLQVRNGHMLDLENLDLQAFDINDIAISLARTPRFRGHTTNFFSVATHSVFVSMHMRHVQGIKEREKLLWGLLHDAHEAYVGDIPTPVKLWIEKRSGTCLDTDFFWDLDQAIAHKFSADCGAETRNQTAVSDARVLLWERGHLLPHRRDWGKESLPLTFEENELFEDLFTARMLEGVNAEIDFLRCFALLTT